MNISIQQGSYDYCTLRNLIICFPQYCYYAGQWQAIPTVPVRILDPKINM